MNTKSKISLVSAEENLKDIDEKILIYFEKIKKYEPDYILPETISSKSSSLKLNKKVQRVVDLVGYVFIALIIIFVLLMVISIIVN